MDGYEDEHGGGGAGCGLVPKGHQGEGEGEEQGLREEIVVVVVGDGGVSLNFWHEILNGIGFLEVCAA